MKKLHSTTALISESRVGLPRWVGTVALLLAVIAVEKAAAGWPYVATRESFVFHADFPLDTNQKLVHELVALRSELYHQLGLEPNRERIDVYLFGDKSVYELYMKRYFPSLKPRRAMFIKSNSPGNVFAYISPQFDVDLRHESTHSLLHATLPMVPLWLDEGLAEYYEMQAADRHYGHPYLKQVQRSVVWRRPPSIQHLESLTELKQMGPEEYRQAWSWVHFMLHGPAQARQVLVEYLGKVSRHEPPPPISESLRHAMSDLDRAYVDHFRKLRRPTAANALNAGDFKQR